MYKHVLKRVLDVVISLTALVIVSPLLLIVALLLLLFNEGEGVFFIQERPGKDGRLFPLVKFKTMKDTCNSCGQLLPDEERLTSIGRWIRSTSIDELPQLINVLKGDMSLIGPRPLLPQYLRLYNERQRRRHDVRPGISGWAQINGRNRIPWPVKLEYDVWYVEHISFRIDLIIFLRTIRNVFLREGINANDNNTMHPFLGND